MTHKAPLQPGDRVGVVDPNLGDNKIAYETRVLCLVTIPQYIRRQLEQEGYSLSRDEFKFSIVPLHAPKSKAEQMVIAV